MNKNSLTPSGSLGIDILKKIADRYRAIPAEIDLTKILLRNISI